ncbi:PH domain-containing protein [Streptomyces sp. NBC_00820]|uniref:PH domain-containing protein n=1 Tax=Streptomyces sp. NBC_00820 TaxID=2975842 RepID=UPI002ED514B3|nr:PH domain-containing protein [Streptomyces sp. NBC_00820]
MTTPDHKSPAPQPTVPLAKDRIYRSPLALVGGVLLLVLVAWLGVDALLRGHGHTPWLALAGMILAFPLVGAFTLRPAVFVNEDRLRVRNPFRVVTLPWGEVAALRSGYSNEAVAKSGTKYQLWAIPVSLRARKKATRNQARAAAEAARGGRGRGGRFGGGGGSLGAFGGGATTAVPARAETDKIMDDLRETLERRGEETPAQGEVVVRWAYEVMAPALAGAVLLAVLLATG